MGDVRRLYGPDGRVDWFFVDGSGNLKHKSAPAGGPWSSIETVMTGCTANGAVDPAWNGEALDVYVKGASGSDVKHAWNDGSWHTETL